MNASEQIPPDEARPPATPLEAMVADIQRIIAEGEAEDGAPSRPGLSAEGRAVRVEEAESRWSPAAAGRAVSIAGIAVLALGGLAWLALAAAHRPAPPVDATDQTAAAAGEDEREALRRAIEERDAEIQRLAAYARELEAQQASLRARVDELSRRASLPGEQPAADAKAGHPPAIVVTRIMGIDGERP